MTTTISKEKEQELSEGVEILVRQARLAAAVWLQYTQEQVDEIVKAMTMAAIEAASELAIEAHQETRMGIIEDKMLKNFVASEFHYHQIKDVKTVGVIKEMPEDNMVEVAEPVGVILALSPVTNPTSTVIFKSIAAAKTRNSVIFSSHLMAANASNHAAQIVYEAGLAAGAPKGFITWVEKSARLRRGTELMMNHPEVDLIFATGGTAMVRAAMSTGKPALGVGPGNTPVYIHKSASPSSAAMDVIISKTFDNGTECPSEQTIVVDREILHDLLEEFKRLGCYVCSLDEVEKIADVVIDSKGGMNYKCVGQSANFIADLAGVDVPDDTKILLCPMGGGDIRNHRLAVEKLMPVLGYVVVDSVEDGINRALDVNYAGGTGHTAGIFCEDEAVVEQFTTNINAGRIIVNSPCCIGGLGGIYNNLNTTLSFGCGTGGGNNTSDNVGIKNLLNYKRVPKRTNFTLSFSTTKNIYINPGSLEHLRSLKTKSAVILTSKSSAKRGHLAMVTERLPSDCNIGVFAEIGVEPDFSDVEAALLMMRQHKPDTVIALGGGSVIDASKIIRLFYDHPHLNMAELSISFLDFRHRMVEFPQTFKTQLVAIPTTSGTGSEVTPFAVLKDNVNKRKISLVDQCLLPDYAIIDANLTKSLPKDITADTAFDALTHALESLVSTLASDYTDGLALESMRLIFEALPEALKNPNNIVWRHKLHNASCLAGMAIGNASVGINHALAHSLGALFDIPHGRSNAVFLLSVLDYNSHVPRKFMPTSTYPSWVADQKYARAAQFLGLSDPGPVDTSGKFTKRELESQKHARLSRELQRAVYDLAKSCGQPLSISELGVDADAFEMQMLNMVRLCFGDMSMRTNPSLPLLSEIGGLFANSFAPRERP